MKKKIVLVCFCAILSCCFIAPSAIAQEQHTPTFDNKTIFVLPRADITEWRYKTVNGVRYRRLWNATKRVWAGDWEKY